MKARLHLIEGGRVVERRRDPEANPFFVGFLWAVFFACLLIAAFVPIA